MNEFRRCQPGYSFADSQRIAADLPGNPLGRGVNPYAPTPLADYEPPPFVVPEPAQVPDYDPFAK